LVALAGPPTDCGSLDNAYGPYDYRTSRAALAVVERVHFTVEVEQLIRGKSGYLGGDLDYTLRASPNHHRALLAMARYGVRLKAQRVPFASYDVECYFVRATRFRPDDTTVRMLYANYLKSQGRTEEGVRQLDVAAGDAHDLGFTHFNLGLSYFDLGVMDKARRHARKALDLGFPKTELRDKLAQIGQWPDEAEPAANPASAPADGGAPR
jgi:Tfp pilus assembly protein PilF